MTTMLSCEYFHYADDGDSFPFVLSSDKTQLVSLWKWDMFDSTGRDLAE